MSVNQYFKIPIPEGYRIFFKEFDLAGAGFRKSEIGKAFSGKQVELALEPEPGNKHDPNAIKVVAHKKGFFRTKTLHIGYVPKEIAKVIADKNLNIDLLPRPKEIWVGDSGGIKVVLDILGLKSDYKKINE